jgi:hypothetical protein
MSFSKFQTWINTLSAYSVLSVKQIMMDIKELREFMLSLEFKTNLDLSARRQYK